MRSYKACLGIKHHIPRVVLRGDEIGHEYLDMLILMDSGIYAQKLALYYPLGLPTFKHFQQDESILYYSNEFRCVPPSDNESVMLGWVGDQHYPASDQLLAGEVIGQSSGKLWVL